MKHVSSSAWPTKPLGELCRIELGSTPARRNALFWDEKRQTDNIWLSIADLPQTLHGIANDSKEYVTDLATQKMRLIPEGTLLVSFKLTLGRLAYAGRDLYSNEAIASLLEIDEQIISKSFLYWALTAFDWDEAAEGDQKIKGKTLNKAKLKLIPVPLPPLEEQQRIVAVLDEAFEGLARARAHAEANLQNVRDLFGSALHLAFVDDSISWNDTVLADLGLVVTGSTPKTSDKGNLGNYLPFVKPGDFLPDGSLIYDNQGLSEKGASVSRVLPAGSTLMVCIGATIGKAGYSDRPIATNQQINAVVPKDGISGEYLYYQMLTPEFQADVMHGSGQATLPIINKGKWSKLTIRVPSDLTKQIEIVDKLSKLRAQIDSASTQYKAQIVDIEDLRQSLLQKAFTGELT